MRSDPFAHVLVFRCDTGTAITPSFTDWCIRNDRTSDRKMAIPRFGSTSAGDIADPLIQCDKNASKLGRYDPNRSDTTDSLTSV